MKYVYVLFNRKNRKVYIGKTFDLKRRLKDHIKGKSFATKKDSKYWKLIYAELFGNNKRADTREYALKHHGSAKQKLMKRIYD